MQEVKNKAGEILGTYELTEIAEFKAQDIETKLTDKEGNERAITRPIDKAGILKLATQQFNTNTRNFVAGLAREKKDTKTAVLKEYIKSLGIDITLPLEELKKALKQ